MRKDDDEDEEEYENWEWDSVGKLKKNKKIFRKSLQK